MKNVIGWSKSGIESLRQKTLHERLLVFLGGLLSLSAMMAGYFYYADYELSHLASQVVAAHQLSVECTRLDEELIHTQLEISELAQGPANAQSRADDIAEMERYRQALENEIDLVQKYAQEHSLLLRTEMVGRIQYLHDAYPGLKKVWAEFVGKVQKNRSEAEIRESYQGMLGYFDELGFSRVVRDIVKIGADHSHEAETRIQLMAVRQRIIMTISVTLIFILGVIVSFLHRKAIEGQVHELQLAHASKLASLGELSAGVAHELNSPLMFIKGYNNRVRSVLMQAQFDASSPVWQHLDQVDDGVGRITKIVRYFRDFSRMSDATKMEPRSVNEMIENSFILLNDKLRQSGIEVRKCLSPNDPKVLCNSDRLEQVLINLLNNSVDAMENVREQNRSIIVQSEVEGDSVVLKLQDSGIGISKEVQARIFDPFFTTKPLGKGTGLGLSISQGIIRDHLGTISVESIPNERTCFTIRLPLDHSASLNVPEEKDAA